ncbi:MAG TPA: hypothetical protein EYN60_02705 [Nitrospirales bacterium]|nr:hypothetical protein [Nitrospirales bacterium]HIC04603.1 hypothetical protein [Nitrospirales bacterium]HIN33800.1 hypothetical protein [Nitrospirales bacterium]HIO69025.1 hypothetical protein [Nitrospirales bacterium]
MTIEANADAERRTVLMKSIGVMVCQAAAVLIAVALGIILILVNLGNGIKGIKLGWFMLTHPSKWLSVGTVVGTPVWEVLAIASLLLGAVLIYEMVRLVRRPLPGQMPRMKKFLLGCFLLIAAPLLTFLADTGQWWVMKHAFDYETKMYVLTGVQNDYDRWFLKTTSSVSEKELQRDFWAGFRKYFHDDELEILDDDVAADTRQVEWWHVEYTDLIEVIKQSPHRAIATSYRAGSTGNRQGRLKTSIGKDGGVVLQLVLGIDGSLSDVVNAPQVTTVMRDNDRDGTPDEFQTIPAMEWGYTGPVTLEGFIPLKREAGFDVVYGLWSQGIGYAVNFFLHGYDSTLPRGLFPGKEQDV